MAMSGLELALDLSRTEFSLNKSSRNLYNNYTQSVTSNSTRFSNYDAGLQYIPGEFGAYQTILRKEHSHYLSVAMLALSSSEPERSASRSSDTSGVSTMTSGSYIDNSSLKLRYQNVELKPVMHESRNILDLSSNIIQGRSFFTPALADPNPSRAITYSEKRIKKLDGPNLFKKCPDCDFEMPIEFLPEAPNGKSKGDSCLL